MNHYSKIPAGRVVSLRLDADLAVAINVQRTVRGESGKKIEPANLAAAGDVVPMRVLGELGDIVRIEPGRFPRHPDHFVPLEEQQDKVTVLEASVVAGQIELGEVGGEIRSVTVSRAGYSETDLKSWFVA